MDFRKVCNDRDQCIQFEKRFLSEEDWTKFVEMKWKRISKNGNIGYEQFCS